jgi:hypothetical protein
MEDTFPDLGSLSDEELKNLIDKLTEEENEISYKRRVLHGKIDILRAELVNRLRQKREQGEPRARGRVRRLAEQDRWPSTVPNAVSSTPRALTTAKSAVLMWAVPPRAMGAAVRNRRR